MYFECIFSFLWPNIFFNYGTIHPSAWSSYDVSMMISFKNELYISFSVKCVGLRLQQPKGQVTFNSFQLFSNVELCDPLNCSMPGLRVHHQPPEIMKTHVH